jgi:hypothetical protein
MKFIRVGELAERVVLKIEFDEVVRVVAGGLELILDKLKNARFSAASQSYEYLDEVGVGKLHDAVRVERTGDEWHGEVLSAGRCRMEHFHLV